MISQLRAQLERDEGRSSTVYQDSLGYWTIGIGKLVDERKGGGLSADEIDYILSNTSSVRASMPWTVARAARIAKQIQTGEWQ